MAIEKELLDQLLAGRDPQELFAKDGLVDELKKALSERILNAEIDDHLDFEKAAGTGNHRNGYSKKSVLTGTSKVTLDSHLAPRPPLVTEALVAMPRVLLFHIDSDHRVSLRD